MELLEIAKELLDKENKQPQEWDGPPQPFMEYHRQSFPVEVFPDWLHNMARSVAVALQVPLDMVGMIILAAAAASVARRYRIKARPGWIELLGLYVIPILETGNRKSGTLKELTAPFEYFEAELLRELTPTYEIKKHELDLLKAQLEDLKKSYVKAKNQPEKKGTKPAYEIKSDIDALSKEISETPVPCLPTVLTGDVTEEKTIMLAAENNGYIAHFSAEGELFANAAGRYNSQVPKFEALLKGYSGDPIRQDRIGRAPQYVPEPCFTVATVVQPIVLKEAAQKPEFRHKGLLGRFLYSVPVSPLGYRITDADSIPEEVKTRYWNGILRLLRDSWSDDDKLELVLSADANKLLADFERELEPQLRPDGELRLIVDWAAKLAGNIVRIAGLLHLADHAGDRSKPLTVPGDSMQRALTLAPYLINHAKIAFLLMETADDETIIKAKKVIRWMKDNDLAEFTQRDCHRANQATFRSAEEVKEVLRILSDHEYIHESHTDDQPGPGRKKSTIYKINPYMTEMTEMTEYHPEAYSVNSVNIVTKATNLKSEIEPDSWLEIGTEVAGSDLPF